MGRFGGYICWDGRWEEVDTGFDTWEMREVELLAGRLVREEHTIADKVELEQRLHGLRFRSSHSLCRRNFFFVEPPGPLNDCSKSV